jgi:hypothetical protein
MTTEEKLKMYREKKHFIYDVSMAFIKNPTGHTIEDIGYEVFFRETRSEVEFAEWLIVQYRGGAKAYRCITWNSNTANFMDIAEMLDGGCYGESSSYYLLGERGWKKLDLTKMCALHEVK